MNKALFGAESIVPNFQPCIKPMYGEFGKKKKIDPFQKPSVVEQEV